MITDKMKKLTCSNNRPHFINDVCVEYKTICLSYIDKTIKLLNTLFDKGVNVNKILEYEIDDKVKCNNMDFEKYQDGWVVSTRVTGNHIHDNTTFIKRDNESDVELLAKYYEALRVYSKNISMYANVQQEIIDKFVRDYYVIYKSDLMMDANVNNVLFDGDKFSFINLYYNEGTKNKLGFFIRDVLDLLIFQPPYILLEDDSIIDDIPVEMYSSLSTNIKLLLDSIMLALSKLPISSFRVEKEVIDYLTTKESLIHGGINQDDLLSKLKKEN